MTTLKERTITAIYLLVFIAILCATSHVEVGAVITCLFWAIIPTAGIAVLSTTNKRNNQND